MINVRLQIKVKCETCLYNYKQSDEENTGHMDDSRCLREREEMEGGLEAGKRGSSSREGAGQGNLGWPNKSSE